MYAIGDIRVQFKGRDKTWYKNGQAYTKAIEKGIKTDTSLYNRVKEWGNNNWFEIFDKQGETVGVYHEYTEAVHILNTEFGGVIR